jgi:hypothetical protein
MQEASHENLRLQLASAKMELQKETAKYSNFLTQLELLQRSLDSNELSDQLLKSALDAFPPGLRPVRAATPAGEGRKETRRLWEELNHIVRSRQEKDLRAQKPKA